jgi:hypothetical protein
MQTYVVDITMTDAFLPEGVRFDHLLETIEQLGHLHIQNRWSKDGRQFARGVNFIRAETVRLTSRQVIDAVEHLYRVMSVTPATLAISFSVRDGSFEPEDALPPHSG